jgi:hypothetical protein
MWYGLFSVGVVVLPAEPAKQTDDAVRQKHWLLSSLLNFVLVYKSAEFFKAFSHRSCSGWDIFIRSF